MCSWAIETHVLWAVRTELFKMFGMNLNFFTHLYLQTDGQTKRVNVLLELNLRHYVSTTQIIWQELLDITRFSYNNSETRPETKSHSRLLRDNHTTIIDAKCSYTEVCKVESIVVQILKRVARVVIFGMVMLTQGRQADEKVGHTKRCYQHFELGDSLMAKLH